MPDAKTIPGPTPVAPRIAVARLGAVTGGSDQVSDWIDVDFNPASLQLQVSNELKDTQNNERKQYIAKTSAKLTMELLFDTTDDGADVTQTTRKLQAFIAPPSPPGQPADRQVPPPVVLFEWGRIKFKGIAESYKETIDFFSASGVPLRASVNLTLSRQDKVFDDSPGSAPESGDDDALDTPAGSAADIANAAESPDAARAVGEANGQESLRFGSGSPLTVSASITLKPPAAFASAGGGLGIGFGASAGIGIGGSAGIGIGGSAGIGIGGGAGIGVGGGAGVGINAGASAGVGISGLSRLSATEGAFAGLRVSARAGASTARLNTSRLLPQVKSAALSTDRNASFRVGGKATLEGAAGLGADVGGRGAPRAKLSFDKS
jgi:hypothetical protein